MIFKHLQNLTGKTNCKGSSGVSVRNRILTRITAAALSVFIIAASVPCEPASAALSTVSAASRITSFASSTSTTDRLEADLTDEYTLHISCVSSLPSYLYRISLYKIGENKGDIKLGLYADAVPSLNENGEMSYGFEFDLTTLEIDVPDGNYNLYIHRAVSPEDALKPVFRGEGLLYKNLEINVKNDKISILRFDDVINYNNSIRQDAAPYDLSHYLDTSLSDIRFTLKNPATGYYDTMSDYKISYLRTISDRVCQGCSSDYDKLKAIYTYVASNFYYDTIAFQTHSLQYANPYENVFHFENGMTSSNSINGKVFTTCQGYSAIYTILARLQGIPTRFVYGHRLAVPSNDWYTESNITSTDHWWVESYVNGRWIYADPTVGTTSKYNKNTREWTENGLTNYVYFDPTPEQIATSTVYKCVYPNYRKGQYISNEYEKTVLRKFFSTIVPEEDGYAYLTNGKLINSKYNAYDTTTWEDGYLSHFKTDGRGNTEQIKWNHKGFYGDLSLPGFVSMKSFSAYGNELETVNLSGCTALEKIYLYNNGITTLDLTGCVNSDYIRCKNNPMKFAALYICGADRTFECGEHGYFYFTTDKKWADRLKEMSLYSCPDIGYMPNIVDVKKDKVISTKKLYDFNPTASSYRIDFVPDPGSYVYQFNSEDRTTLTGKKRSYLQAMALRLNDLGYYEVPGYGAKLGEENYYSPALEQAVTKFQIMNGFTNRGTCDKETWSALFTDGAVRMVSDAEFDIIAQEYQAKLHADMEAFDTLPIKASSVAGKDAKGKGYLTINWEITDAPAVKPVVTPAETPAPDTTVTGMETVQPGADQTAAGAPVYGTQDSSPADNPYAVTEITIPENTVTAEPEEELPIYDYKSVKVDGYQIQKATDREFTSGLVTSTQTASAACTKTYKSTVTSGTRYYFRVRAYKVVDGMKYYSEWSNITYRICK